MVRRRKTYSYARLSIEVLEPLKMVMIAYVITVIRRNWPEQQYDEEGQQIGAALGIAVERGKGRSLIGRVDEADGSML